MYSVADLPECDIDRVEHPVDSARATRSQWGSAASSHRWPTRIVVQAGIVSEPPGEDTVMHETVQEPSVAAFRTVHPDRRAPGVNAGGFLPNGPVVDGLDSRDRTGTQRREPLVR
jgi:hypothetical protein